MRCSVSWRSMRLFALFLRHSFSRGSKRLSPQDLAPPHLRKWSSVSFVVLQRGHNGEGQELYWCSRLCVGKKPYIQRLRIRFSLIEKELNALENSFHAIKSKVPTGRWSRCLM